MSQVFDVVDTPAFRKVIALRQSEDTEAHEAERDLSKKISDYQRRIQRLEDEYDDGGMTKADYARRRDRMTKIMGDLMAERDRLTRGRSGITIASGNELRREWETRDATWKRTILAQVIEKITVSGLPRRLGRSIQRKRGETDAELAKRRDMHQAGILAQRVAIEWLV